MQGSQTIDMTAVSLAEMDGILARILRPLILAGNIITHRQYYKEALSWASL